MKVEFYIPERNYEELKSWYYKREVTPPPKEAIPPTGVHIIGYGSCFLIGTDSGMCLIEGLVTNPARSRKERNRAAKALIKRILEIAKARRFTNIVGISKIDRVSKEYGTYFNFKELGNYIVIMKQL